MSDRQTLISAHLKYLTARQQKIMDAIPRGFETSLTWERIVQSVGQELSKPGQGDKLNKLLECAPDSLYTSVLKIVGHGLDIGMGEAFLVPYSKSVTPMISAKGYIALAYRSGKVERMTVQLIHENDNIELDLEAGTVRHVVDGPTLREWAKNGRGAEIGCYATAMLVGARAPILEFMDLETFTKIREQAKEKNFGRESEPYKKWAGEMWRRSTLSRLIKRLPISRVIPVDEEDPAPTAAPEALGTTPDVLADLTDDQVLRELEGEEGPLDPNGPV